MIEIETAGIFTDGITDTVSYDDGTGGVDVSAVVAFDENNGGADMATILVKKSEVANPDYRDSFTIDGVVWRIVGGKNKGFVLGQDENTWLLQIRARQRSRQWRT